MGQQVQLVTSEREPLLLRSLQTYRKSIRDVLDQGSGFYTTQLV